MKNSQSCLQVQSWTTRFHKKHCISERLFIMAGIAGHWTMSSDQNSGRDMRLPETTNSTFPSPHSPPSACRKNLTKQLHIVMDSVVLRWTYFILYQNLHLLELCINILLKNLHMTAIVQQHQGLLDVLSRNRLQRNTYLKDRNVQNNCPNNSSVQSS